MKKLEHKKTKKLFTWGGGVLFVLLLFGVGIAVVPPSGETHLLRGLQYDEEDRLDEALIELRAAVQKAPDLTEARLNLGLIYFQKGQLGLALGEFSRLIELNPDHVIAHLHLARIHLRARDFEKADHHLGLLQSLAPNNAERLGLQAEYWAAAKGKLDEAETALQQSLTIDPQRVESLLQMGNLKMFRGRDDEGKEWFDRALALVPENLDAQLALGRWFGKQEDSLNAELYIKKASEGHPKSPLPHLALASLYRLHEQSDLVLKELEAAQHLDPESLSLKFELGEELLRQKHIKEGFALVKPLLANSFRNPQALYLRGRLHLSEGNIKDAIPDLQTVVRIVPTFTQARLLLALVYEADGSTELAQREYEIAAEMNPNASEIRQRLASLHLRTGRPSEAIRYAKDLVEEGPKDTKAQGLLAAAYFQDKQMEEAEREFSKLIEIAPEYPGGYFNRGVSKLASGKIDEAIQDFREAVSRQSSLLEKISVLTVALSVKDQKQADRLATFIEEIDSHGPLGPFTRGLIAFNLKKSGEGQAFLQSAIKRNDEFLPARISLAQWHYIQGQFPEAIEEYQAVLGVHEQNIKAIMGLGDSYLALEDYEDAAKYYKMALDLSPKIVSAMNNLAWSYSMQDSTLDQALSFAQQARQLAPQNAAVIDTLGQIFLKQHSYEEALAAFEEAKGLAPKYPDVHFHLAQVLVAEGKMKEAREALKEFLALAPKMKERTDVHALALQLNL